MVVIKNLTFFFIQAVFILLWILVFLQNLSWIGWLSAMQFFWTLYIGNGQSWRKSNGQSGLETPCGKRLKRRDHLEIETTHGTSFYIGDPVPQNLVWHQNHASAVTTQQKMGRWESNINGWFPFMYSQKWNCYFQNRVIMFCLSLRLR